VCAHCELIAERQRVMAKQVALRRAQEQDKQHAKLSQIAGKSSPGDSQPSSTNGLLSGGVRNGSTSSTSGTSGSGSSMTRGCGSAAELNAGRVLSAASDRLTAALVNESAQFSAFSAPSAISADCPMIGGGSASSLLLSNANPATGSSSPADLMMTNGHGNTSSEMDSGRTSFAHLVTGKSHCSCSPLSAR
jgi:hypothetical protein